MKEVVFKYFIDGEQVNPELVNWENSVGVSIGEDQVDILFDPDLYYCEKVFTDKPGCCQKEIDPRSSEAVSIEYRGCETATPSEHRYDGASQYSGTLKIEDIGLLSMGINPTEKLYVTGVKHNSYKAPLDIVQTRQFPKALQMVALATAFGNKKYEATDKDFLNFKRVAGGSQTYFDAAARHNTERDEVDEDSGLPHLVHAVWNMLAGLELHIEEHEVNVKEFSKEFLEGLHMSK